MVGDRVGEGLESPTRHRSGGSPSGTPPVIFGVVKTRKRCSTTILKRFGVKTIKRMDILVRVLRIWM